MNHHLDLREIPALLDRITHNAEEEKACIGLYQRHAVAVVDGVIHDIFDHSQGRNSPRPYEYGEKLVGLWIRNDNPLAVEAGRELMEKYETVRKYDDALTTGRQRRERAGLEKRD